MISGKPLIQDKKATRLFERKAVTIVAGFRCSGGVVLCADTQETTEHAKRNVPKLRIEPPETVRSLQVLSGRDMAVAFCGATNNGAFLDEIIDRAWKKAQAAASLEEAAALISRSLKDSYREFGLIYQRGHIPETELIYGIKMQGESKLFYALGPAVNERTDYATGGIGHYMADFLASRMYDRDLTLRQCVILAAYVVFQAKEHVPYCGGESQITVLRNEDSSGLADARRVSALTELLRSPVLPTSPPRSSLT